MIELLACVCTKTKKPKKWKGGEGPLLFISINKDIHLCITNTLHTNMAVTRAHSNYGLKHKRITPEELVKLPFHMCLPLGKSSPLIYSLKMGNTSAPPHVLNKYFCAAQTILETHGIDAIGYCDSRGKTALSWD